MIVMKFGGTSVQDATAMRKVIDIINKKKSKGLVVVLSACSGITNQLIELADKAPFITKNDSYEVIENIKNRHLKIIDELISTNENKSKAYNVVDLFINDLKTLIEGINLLKECTQRSMAQAMAYGELLSSSIFEIACIDNKINSAFVDARKVMKTDMSSLEAKIIIKEIRKNSGKITKLLKSGKTVITQGFIGSDEDGKTTTLGRGGSDFSAAVFGSILKADEIQIWTDVSGVLTTDPRLVKSAITIPEMTFAEIRELSFYGAKVLHPDTIKPAIEKNIPVRILNTYKPDDMGTLVVDEIKLKKPGIRSVILKQQTKELVIEIPAKENSQNYFSDFIKKINAANIKILYSTCTESNFRLIYEPTLNNDKRKNSILAEYKYSETSCNLLSICGSGLDEGVKSKSITTLINLLNSLGAKQIIYGASPVSILAVFPEGSGLKALKETHKLLV
jgi:aspartate kinase